MATIEQTLGTPSTPAGDNRPLAAPTATEMCKAIEQSFALSGREEIRCVHVYGYCYRCNWWLRDHGALWGSPARIVKSMFLRATLDADGLHIEDLSDGARPARPQLPLAV